MPQSGSSTMNFDLNSQSGVMSVLASIRASSLSNQEKNELRDLVFHYTKSGGDVSVKISLEQKLASHQILPVQIKVPTGQVTGPALAFGSYRPTPTFKTPNPIVTTVVSVAPTPTPAAVVPPAPVAAATVQSTPSVVPAAPVPVTPPPVVVATPAPTPTPAPVAPAVPGGIATEAEYLERIRQIKTAVNSKVGNPVNLVDINNEVGREYMNALLEAMKKLSGGAVSEMGAAMLRLEKAFAAVETAIAEHAKTVPTATTQDTVPVVLTPPVQQPAIAEMVTPVVSVAAPTTPISSVLEPTPTPTPTPTPEIPVDSTLVTRPDLVSPRPAPVFVSPTADEAPVIISEQEPAIPVAVEEKSGYEIPVTPTPTSPSLADKGKILTPEDLPDAATLSTGAAGDNLFTKEIDDGLTLLLSDWTIFKKSGLFGTGPKGREHPLFKKISELQIPLILAGRFEGSSQEIRQSITDYMNGWRYEQGIIYQPGETFEHYLRRVIRHIIDLQNKHR